MSITKTTFKKVRKTDDLHPGFELTGYRIKWVAAKKMEEGLNDDYQILRKDALPQDVQKIMKDSGLFQTTDVIRKNELVLTYISNEQWQINREIKNDDAQKQLNSIQRIPTNTKGFKVDATVSQRVNVDYFDKD